MRGSGFSLLFLVATLFIQGCGGDIDLPEQNETTVIRVDALSWDGVKRADITYQLLVYSFADSDGDGCGDFNGIVSKLDYLDELGISALWLSPIHPSASYHGYDVIDYSAVNPQFGTMDDFKNLVQQAHRHGIKIYLDYVLNHSSTQSEWFLQAKESEDSPYRDFYVFSENPQADIKAGVIPMISSQGSSGYVAGEWFRVKSSEITGVMTFTLDWSDTANPKLTVERGGSVDADNPDTSTKDAKYLYFGDGVIKKFYDRGNGLYSLTVDYESEWGFLIRTSSTDWGSNTKFGAQTIQDKIIFGEAFRLFTSSNADNVSDICFKDERTLYYHSHFQTDWFADLNYGPAELAQNSPAFKAVVDAAKVWIDAGIDGFRLDAVKHIYHNAISDENPVFLKKFYDAVNDYYHQNHSSDFYMVGENFSEAAVVAPYYAGLPAMFDFSFWWRTSEALNNGKGSDFASKIVSNRDYCRAVNPDFIDATKLSNHDEDRALTTLGGDSKKAKMAASFLMTSAGSPYIYYGEELGVSGSKAEGDLNVRKDMNWKNAENQKQDAGSFLTHYLAQTALRNTFKALAKGEMSVFGGSVPQSVAAWYMEWDGQRLLVVHNVGTSLVSFSMDADLSSPVFVDGYVATKKIDNGYSLIMDGMTSVIFEIK